jgi:hypothetical protein
MRQAVLKKYEDVRMRGRKRDMVGWLIMLFPVHSVNLI